MRLKSKYLLEFQGAEAECVDARLGEVAPLGGKPLLETQDELQKLTSRKQKFQSFGAISVPVHLFGAMKDKRRAPAMLEPTPSDLTRNV